MHLGWKICRMLFSIQKTKLSEKLKLKLHLHILDFNHTSERTLAKGSHNFICNVKFEREKDKL